MGSQVQRPEVLLEARDVLGGHPQVPGLPWEVEGLRPLGKGQSPAAPTPETCRGATGLLLVWG